MASTTDVKPLADTITCHAWNHDGSMVAICPNTPEVWVYTGCENPDSSTWVLAYVLKEHDLVVSGIDWHPVTNRIVTCSHDRNAFVWTHDSATDTWKPCIAILRINRAATSVKWSPDGQRFAVASGARVVPVCTYEVENDWWVSNQVRKHRSTVLSVAWHPNSQIIATACADFKCRVFSVTDTELGDVPDAGPFPAPNEFGGLYIELDDARGWVNDVEWSPSGTRLTYVGHDSSLHMVQFEPSAEPILQTILCTHLPFTRVAFLSENVIVAAGHQMNPTVYAFSDGLWAMHSQVDTKTSTAAATSKFDQRRAMFSKGGSASSSTPKDTVWTKHKGAITDLRLLGVAPAGAGLATSGRASGFSSSGNDGRLLKWDTPAAVGKL